MAAIPPFPPFPPLSPFPPVVAPGLILPHPRIAV